MDHIDNSKKNTVYIVLCGDKFEKCFLSFEDANNYIFKVDTVMFDDLIRERLKDEDIASDDDDFEIEYRRNHVFAINNYIDDYTIKLFVDENRDLLYVINNETTNKFIEITSDIEVWKDFYKQNAKKMLNKCTINLYGG
jgi:hypothetical protein